MVHYCCFGCNEKFVKGGTTTFHSFPKDETRRKLLLQKIRRKDFVPSTYSKVCSKHFTEEYFDREKFGGVWLKRDAVPTIFNFPKHLTPKVSCRKSPVKRSSAGLPVHEQKDYCDAVVSPSLTNLKDDDFTKCEKISYIFQ